VGCFRDPEVKWAMKNTFVDSSILGKFYELFLKGDHYNIL
jgi:hypothetical protein